jgi:hypothetical protein
MSDNLMHGLQLGHLEGQSVWDIEVASLRGAIRSSDQGVREAVAGFLGGIWTLKTEGMRQCLLCTAVFTPTRYHAGLAMLRAHVPDAQHRFTSGLCRHCFARPDVRPAVNAALSGLLKNPRQIQLGAAGHA